MPVNNITDAKKDLMVCYRFPRDLNELLEAAASSRGIAKSDIVREGAEAAARCILAEDVPFEGFEFEVGA